MNWIKIGIKLKCTSRYYVSFFVSIIHLVLTTSRSTQIYFTVGIKTGLYSLTSFSGTKYIEEGVRCLKVSCFKIMQDTSPVLRCQNPSLSKSYNTENMIKMRNMWFDLKFHCCSGSLSYSEQGFCI